MNGFYFICYGESEENMSISIDKKIIGSSNGTRIPKDQLVYLILKRDGVWTVIGRARVDVETEENPFKKPNRFKTYLIKNVEKCRPYAISEALSNLLGNRYGLVLRSPMLISNEELIKFLDKNFKE